MRKARPSFLTIILAAALVVLNLCALEGPSSAGDVADIIPADQTPEPGMKIALLENPVPQSGSAAELIELAHEYGWNWDPETKAVLLQEAADWDPGSSDAAIALLELARLHCEEGEVEQAEAAFSEAAKYQDAEIQAFVVVMRTLCDTLREKDYARAEQWLQETAERWAGKELGGWASLQLGNLLRDYTAEFRRAIPYYRAAMESYPGTLVAEEAELSIAECLSWSMARPARSAKHYEAALEHLTSPRLRARAITGYAITLCLLGEYADAFALLTDFVEHYPYDPCVPLARAYRAFAAVRLDDWETAVADAQAFVEAPIGQRGHPWLHNSEHTLGLYSFNQDEDYEEALAHFERAIEAAPDPEAKSKSSAWAARSKVQLGDHEGAVELFLAAAEATQMRTLRCAYLQEAAEAAADGGDKETAKRIRNLVLAECVEPAEEPAATPSS